MATLEARITELEKQAGTQDVQQWLIILTGFDQAEDPVTKLSDGRTGRVWEIQDGETQDDFTARIKRDAFAVGQSGCLVVTRAK